jgi:SAM-dependent methyltransferase
VKYYEAHEGVYRRLRDDGHACWDKTAFDQFYMRPFLEEALDRIGPGLAALDLGCGTGPATLTLAARGYRAVGVDISPTAIAMAEVNAAGRAEFRVGDVLSLDEEGVYDLVVDSHCLHCIVFDDERKRALDVVHRALKVDGAFVCETMSRHALVSFDDAAFRLDDDGVLWRDDQPQRRLLDPSQLRAENERAGFSLELERVTPALPHEPANYQVIARRRGGLRGR